MIAAPEAVCDTGQTMNGLPVADVLITDAGMRQALVAARSLGRSGLNVALAESPDAVAAGLPVPAFASRWSASQTWLPGLQDDPDEYARALLQLVGQLGAKVLIPNSDGSIAALRPWRSEFEGRGVSIALASEPALDAANDKKQTLGIAADLGIAFPRSAPVDRPSDIRDALSTVGYPAVIKPTRSWVRNEYTAIRVISQVVRNECEALAAVEKFSELGSPALAQEWVGGAREAVSLLYADGRFWAEFAQVAHRTTPVLGGLSVVREGIPMPEDLRTAAEELVRAIGLEGCSEVEFRRDSTGRACLMEINARLSGSVEAAVRSGVDFPTLLWRWSAGEPLSPVNGYRTGLRMRFLKGDVWWLAENIVHPGRPDSVSPSRAAATFVAEFFRRNAYDLVDRKDMRPAMAALRYDVASAHRRVFRRLAKRPGV
jgi:predicted ATP-grasp superfamily ATP-dependent carboligase